MPESQVPASEYSLKKRYWEVRTCVCVYVVTKWRRSPRERPGSVHGVSMAAGRETQRVCEMTDPKKSLSFSWFP